MDGIAQMIIANFLGFFTLYFAGNGIAVIIGDGRFNDISRFELIKGFAFELPADPFLLDFCSEAGIFLVFEYFKTEH